MPSIIKPIDTSKAIAAQQGTPDTDTVEVTGTVDRDIMTIIEESEIYDLYDFIYPGEHISKMAKFLNPAEAEPSDI